MTGSLTLDLIGKRYRETHGAWVSAGYADLLSVGGHEAPQAALGYRRARGEALFLERYLAAPVEECLGMALGRPVARESVIEIGNLAAVDAFAMISLWGMAANDLGAACEIAVATLTAPLRAMFTRIGIELVELAPATRELADDPAAWGCYYDADPVVCAGSIAQGQSALTAFLSRRRARAAA